MLVQFWHETQREQIYLLSCVPQKTQINLRIFVFIGSFVASTAPSASLERQWRLFPGRPCHNMGRVKRRSAFEHAQNAPIHIILHMRKVLSGHLLSTEIFCSIKWFSLQTAKAQIRLRGCAVWSGPLLSAYTKDMISRGTASHVAAHIYWKEAIQIRGGWGDYANVFRVWHYENMPIQIYWKFFNQKRNIFRKKNLIVLIFLLKT